MIRFVLLLALAARGVSSVCQDTTSELQIQVRLVRVPVIAIGRDGLLLQGLGKNSFAVYDDGKRQSITQLWNDSDASLTIGLVLDTSGSQLPNLIQNRQTLMDFLQTLLRPGDKAFLETFDSQARIAADLSETAGPIVAMLNRFTRIRPNHPHWIGSPMAPLCEGGQKVAGAPCGNSVVWHAVAAAAEKLKHSEGRRVILLITDGEDSGSDFSMKQAAAAAQDAEATVFTVGLPAPEHKKLNRGQLETISKMTGGRAMLDRADLRADFAGMNKDLRAEYVLAFTPDRTIGQGTSHRLKVIVNEAKQVFAREEYIERPAEAPH